MKAKFLLIVSALAMFSFTASAEDVISHKWSAPLVVNGTKSTAANINRVIPGPNNSFYTIANYQTNGEENVEFMGVALPATQCSSATAPNHNLVVVKHDIDGNVDWTIYSNGGYCDVTNTALAPTADGGAYMLIKARHVYNNENGSNVLITLKGTNNTEKSLIFNFEEESGLTDYSWVYQLALAKISNTGEIESLRRAYVSWAVQPEASTTKTVIVDGVYVDGSAVDNDGNFFVVGRNLNTLTFDNDENGQTSIPYHNMDGWNGDTQSSRGGSYILKFNSDLKLTDYAVTSGETTYDNLKGIIFANGKLYVSGLVSPKEGAGFSFQGKDIYTTAPEFGAIWSAVIDPANLSCSSTSMATGYKPEGRKSSSVTYSNMTTSNDGSHIYFTGCFMGGLTIGSSSIEASSDMNHGFFARMNADGIFTDGAVVETSFLTNVTSVIDNSDSIYVFGYDMEKTVGPFFKSYTVDNLEAKSSYKLFSGTNASTVSNPCFAVNGDNIIVILRAKSKITPAYGGTEFGNTTAFYGVSVCFNFKNFDFGKMPEPTPAAEAQDESDSANIYSQNGMICISNAEGSEISVYNLAGIRIAYTAKAEAFVSVPASKGLYIVKIDQTTNKVLVSQ